MWVPVSQSALQLDPPSWLGLCPLGPGSQPPGPNRMAEPCSPSSTHSRVHGETERPMFPSFAQTLWRSSQPSLPPAPPLSPSNASLSRIPPSPAQLKDYQISWDCRAQPEWRFSCTSPILRYCYCRMSCFWIQSHIRWVGRESERARSQCSLLRGSQNIIANGKSYLLRL